MQRKKVKRFARQNADDYLKLLKKNYEYWNVPFKSPDVIESKPPNTLENNQEPDLEFVDKIYVKLTILKSGKVKVKLIPNFLVLWNTYYSKGKIPPFKSVMAAYKALGFSEEFIEKINKRKETRVAFFKKLEKIIERIFDKKSVPKKKSIKKPIEDKPESDEIENDVDDDDEDDDGPEEDEAIMVDDEDCEEVEEFVDDFIDDD
jgi:hypothetical protein|tara:strand:- start:5171 stop:5782 length:612 start_codon:yes stop_codon:yes gene_type:complete